MSTFIKVPVEISARHIHLSKKDLDNLFGRGYKLKKLRSLSQPGMFAAEETVVICNKQNCLKNVRILGPIRPQTQIEISQTDARALGLKPPLRISEDIRGSAGCQIKGPKGTIDLKEGVIIAWRHLHCPLSFAKKYNLEKRKFVSIKINNQRSLTFHKVWLRISPNYRLAFHLDTDEGNAAGVKKIARGYLIL